MLSLRAGRSRRQPCLRRPSVPKSRIDPSSRGASEEQAPMDARSSRYHETYARWQRDPEGFWREAAREIDWFEPPKKVFDPDAGIYGRWFTGATCNTCYNAIDRHVERGRGNQPAIIYDSPVTSTKRTITYAELQREVAALAAILHDF